MEVANAAAKTSFKFEDMYMCDPKAKHYGFKSWDGTLNLHPLPTISEFSLDEPINTDMVPAQ